MQDPLRLSELMCARLCHDLSGPVGTLMGVISPTEDGGWDAEAAATAAEAASMLGLRLRLLRAAWAGSPAPMTAAEVAALAAGLGTSRRTELDLSRLDRAAVFPPDEARLLLNLMLLALECLSGAGRVAVAGAAGGEVAVAIDGPRAAWPAGLAACLRDERAAWAALRNARSIQAPLTALIAHRCGLRLSLLLPAGPDAAPAPPPLLMSPALGH